MQYSIKGESLPVVILDLEQGEKVYTQAGGMSWMSQNFKMETTSSGLTKGIKRKLSGESFFINRYTALSTPAQIAFSSTFPGSILAHDVGQSGDLIVQKESFLAAEDSVDLDIYFQKRLSAGLFGGEGFIMQRLSGTGLVFLEIDGYAQTVHLGPGDVMLCETGMLAAMSSSCTLSVKLLKGARNVFFGGEGLFITKLTGPGSVVLQTMPLSKFGARLTPFIDRR